MGDRAVIPERAPTDRVVDSKRREGSVMGSSDDELVSSLAIIASKIAPEPQGRTTVTRERLLGWLERQAGARLVLVSAEAGYGKSTLLGEYSRRSVIPCVWYRIDASDSDWLTFLSYLVATLRQIEPHFGRQTEALLRHVAAMGSSREMVVAQFLAELGDLIDVQVKVILDDYHLAGDSEDVRLIMGRLLEHAPPGFRFILALRGRPNLALGRLTARGLVAELSPEELRFSRPEIEALFGATLGQPLDAHSCDVVEERTQGWAASLQLVSASMAVSRPSEIGAFIDALDGATAPIFDFLAEEVLSRISPRSQRVLLHASLIDDVDPALVTAALTATDEPMERSVVATYLDEARMLGLLGATVEVSSTSRIHPLLRQFLEHQLATSTPPEQMRELHAAIARAAEHSAWLAAAKHYALAGQEDDAMRVLGSAAGEALGTGSWGAAVAVISLMPNASPPPAVEVIKARALLAQGKAVQALHILDKLDSKPLGPSDRALLSLTRATAHHQEGNTVGLAEEVFKIAADNQVEPPLRDVSTAWRQLLIACRGGSISDASESLQQLAVSQRSMGLRYFAGVALHNAAGAELARAHHAEALRLAQEALVQLEQVDDGAGILASTRSVIATVSAEQGQLAEGLREAAAAANEPGVTADAIAEAAFLHAVTGRFERARAYLARFDQGDAPWSRELPSKAQAAHARFALRMGEGDLSAASAALEALQSMEAADMDTKSRTAVAAATLALLRGQSDARDVATEAIRACNEQHAWRWMYRARIVDAAARQDGADLAIWIQEAEAHSTLALLELADVVSMFVGLLSPAPDALERSIIQASERWVAALGRQLAKGKSANASAAAALVARFGTLKDAQLLREFDQVARAKSRKRGYVSQLIKRLSPTVRVHDLGTLSYEVGERVITLTETRRKAASLLLFLVTRPHLAAGREQVMEGLWPDQSPRSATNSLHQTLFHLRRDIEPWYEDGFTADYIRMEADMVILDAELFQIDSVAFQRQVADILRSSTATSRGPEMLRLYRGSFAPEFEYEDWSEAWRTALHGAYLHLAQCTMAGLVREKQYELAVETLTVVTTVDPTAFELRCALIACLAKLGSADAAQAHYRALTAQHHRDIGAPMATYDEVIRSLDQRL
jgi:DNA-binding SARP family transcriptional activator